MLRRGARRSWCRHRGRTRSGSSTSASSRPATAASGGSAVSPTTGQSSSSAGTSPPRRTSATRPRRPNRRSQRPSGLAAVRSESCSPIPRPARSARSRSSRITGHASRPPASPPSSRSARSRSTSAHRGSRRTKNGVRERAFGSLKYEHLYRLEIDDGYQLGLEVETYRQLFNTIRPHEASATRRPLEVHLEAINDHQTIKSTEPESLPLS